MQKIRELGMGIALECIKRGDWLKNPYHNYGHTLTVVDNVITIGLASGIDNIKPLVLAAIFHDAGHFSNDDVLNIKEALWRLEFFMNSFPLDCREWGCNWEEVSTILKATQFPYKGDDSKLSIEEMIIRDADTLQCFDNVIQTTINLHVLEYGLSFDAALEKQKTFIKTHHFYTGAANSIANRKRKEALDDATA